MKDKEIPFYLSICLLFTTMYIAYGLKQAVFGASNFRKFVYSRQEYNATFLSHNYTPTDYFWLFFSISIMGVFIFTSMRFLKQARVNKNASKYLS